MSITPKRERSNSGEVTIIHGLGYNVRVLHINFHINFTSIYVNAFHSYTEFSFYPKLNVFKLIEWHIISLNYYIFFFQLTFPCESVEK